MSNNPHENTFDVTLTEFLNMTKVIRMLYGTAPATEFFEKNFTEMTGIPKSSLSKLANTDKL